MGCRIASMTQVLSKNLEFNKAFDTLSQQSLGEAGSTWLGQVCCLLGKELARGLGPEHGDE